MNAQMNTTLKPAIAILLLAALLLACLLLIGLVHLATATGLIIGNAKPSVPRGLYMRDEPHKAQYVTFCLQTRHRTKSFYKMACSRDAPHKTRILKRIVKRNTDGTLIVEGDTPNALDSRILGPITPSQIRGYWRPLI